jgi:hypothetical protein
MAKRTARKERPPQADPFSPGLYVGWAAEEIAAHKRMPLATGKERMFARCSQKELKAEGLLDPKVYAQMSPGLQQIYTGMNLVERRAFAARITSRIMHNGPPTGPNEWLVTFQTGLQMRSVDIPDPEAIRYLAKHWIGLFNAEQRQDDRTVWEPLENSPIEDAIALIVASFDARIAPQLTKKFNEYAAIVADLSAVVKEWLEAGEDASKQDAVNLAVARRRRISVRKVERARSYFAS